MRRKETAVRLREIPALSGRRIAVLQEQDRDVHRSSTQERPTVLRGETVLVGPHKTGSEVENDGGVDAEVYGEEGHATDASTEGSGHQGSVHRGTGQSERHRPRCGTVGAGRVPSGVRQRARDWH